MPSSTRPTVILFRVATESCKSLSFSCPHLLYIVVVTVYTISASLSRAFLKISVASRARGSPRTEGDPKPLFFACSRPQVLKSVKHTKTLQTAVKTHCKEIVSVRHFVNFLLLCLTAFIFCACASVAEQLISINPLLMARSLFYYSAKKRLATLAVVRCFSLPHNLSA